MCLTFLTLKKLKWFDEGALTGMALTDIQKAFDTINHKTLVRKLKMIRFSEKQNGLLHIYFMAHFL